MLSKSSSLLCSRSKLLRCSIYRRNDSSSASTPLLKTALYDLHLEMGGKMVPFAGYHLPVQYEGLGVMKEHLHTRSEGGASLFDVSHMGQIIWRGRDAVKFIESVVVGDIASLREGEGKLSLITNEDGNIVDDTVITNAGDHIYMVVNGACKWKDMDHFRRYLVPAAALEVEMEYLQDRQLLAVQGKAAAKVLQRLAPAVDFGRVGFMTGLVATVAGIPDCRVTRCGYTGEDGFEISVAHSHAEALARAILSNPAVKPAGLGARDSLRLEAGLCLYGNDLDETTNPVEGALTWTMEQGFLGANHFLLPDGRVKPVSRKRVGIAGMKAPARGDTEVYSAGDGARRIGRISSGGFSPSAQKPIAMGYVETDSSQEGTAVQLLVRGKLIPAQITKMPFVATSYYKVAQKV